MRVVPGALFRLPDGTTGMVTSDGGIGITYRMGRIDIGTVAPHIICEPGDGPIQSSAAFQEFNRMIQERDEARRLFAAVTEGHTEAITERDAARAERDSLAAQIVDAQARAARAEIAADKAMAEARAGLSTHDDIDHPSHYTATDFEPVVVIEALNPHAHVASAIKYLARAPHKGQLVEDLRKARWYLLRAVALGVAPVSHPNGRRIAASWYAHYPENLRESAEDAIDYMLAGDYYRAQLCVLACLDTIEGAA